MSLTRNLSIKYNKFDSIVVWLSSVAASFLCFLRVGIERAEFFVTSAYEVQGYIWQDTPRSPSKADVNHLQWHPLCIEKDYRKCSSSLTKKLVIHKDRRPSTFCFWRLWLGQSMTSQYLAPLSERQEPGMVFSQAFSMQSRRSKQGPGGSL